MSFRKRNVGLTTSNSSSTPPQPSPPGTRPSPLDGRPTTSTGTPTLDALLGGHAGLSLGTSLLIEESGTTDFAGTLLRFYAAEGVVQGQQVHIVGVPEGWGRQLPGVTGEKREDEGLTRDKEKMKIAWRYERLGQFGEEIGSRGGKSCFACAFVHKEHDKFVNQNGYSCYEILFSLILDATAPTPNRAPISFASGLPTEAPPPQQPFCHTFDLTKRLIPPSSSLPVIYHSLPPSPADPFTALLSLLTTSLTNSPPSLPHRLLIPNLLSPLIYPSTTTHPHILLPFLHSLRALLRNHPSRLTIMITLPLTLYSRHTGLVCWIELLIDGLIELTSFPHGHYLSASSDNMTAAQGKGKEDEKPQGLLRVLRLPVLSEKGQGVGGTGMGSGGEDMAFWISRRRFVVKPFSLPPVEGDQEAQAEAGGGTKVDIGF